MSQIHLLIVVQLSGWLRLNTSLKEIENINGWVSPRLGITFRLTASTLAIYRPDGRKFLTSIEFEERAERERQRADAERQIRLNAVARLLSMGLSVEIIAQTLELTVEEVEKIKSS